MSPEKKGFPQLAYTGSLLSPREESVLIRILRGLSNRDMATELNISLFTVKRSKQRISEKIERITGFTASDEIDIVNRLRMIGEIELRTPYQ